MKKLILSAIAILALASVNNTKAQGLKDKLNKKLAKKMAAKSEKESPDALPYPDEFSDDFGISGQYHLWRPWVFVNTKPGARNGKELVAHTMTIDFDTEKKVSKVYLSSDQYDEYELESFETYAKLVWESSKIWCAHFRGKNQVSSSATENKTSFPVDFVQIEPGVVALGSFSYNLKAPWVTISEDSYSILNIMAKDKSKLEGLDFEKVKAMCQKRAEEVNEIYRNARAGKIKLPAQGMIDAAQVKEAHDLMHEAAKTDDAGNWDDTHIYTYVHSKDWGVTYKDREKTIPVKRRLAIIGVANSKTQEGKCFYQVGYLQQDWNGSGWSDTFFSGFGGGKTHTSCENAQEYK